MGQIARKPAPALEFPRRPFLPEAAPRSPIERDPASKRPQARVLVRFASITVLPGPVTATGETGPSSPSIDTGGASAPSRQRQAAKPGYRPRLPVTSHRRCRSRPRVRTLSSDRFAPARWHQRVCGHWRWMARVQVGRRVRTANPANLVLWSDGGAMLRSRPPYWNIARKDPFCLGHVCVRRP